MKSRVLPISIVIPAKNEGEGIKEIIRSVKPYAKDIIVVDANSKDGTREIAQSENVRFYTDNGKGRGSGVILGIKKSLHSIIVLVDADGSHNTGDIPILVSYLKVANSDMVIASRRTGGSTDMQLNINGLLRSLGSDILTMLLNYRFKTNYTDILYSFRVLKKEKFHKAKIHSQDFAIEQDMLIAFLKKGYKVVEIPSRESARKWGKSKLRTITGIKLLIQLMYSLYKE